jgi:hypothetical protein
VHLVAGHVEQPGEVLGVHLVARHGARPGEVLGVHLVAGHVEQPGEVLGVHLVARHVEQPGEVLGVIVLTHQAIPLTHPPGEVLGVRTPLRHGFRPGEVLGVITNLEKLMGQPVQLLARDPTQANFFSLSSTVDTVIYSLPFTAGQMGPNSTVKIWTHGEMINNSGATCTFTFTLTLGSTVIWSDSTIAYSSVANYAPWEVELLFEALNATNKQFAFGKLFIGPLAAALTGTGDLGLNPKMANPFDSFAFEDMTVAKTLTLSVRANVKHASCGFTRYYAYAEITP